MLAALWDDPFVVTTRTGMPVSASNFHRRHFIPVAMAAGLPVGRQTSGSLLVTLGVEPKLVQTLLRHSKLSTTMDLSVHAFDDDLREAVRTVEHAVSPTDRHHNATT